jgi:hypothetical protein
VSPPTQAVVVDDEHTTFVCETPGHCMCISHACEFTCECVKHPRKNKCALCAASLVEIYMNTGDPVRRAMPAE